MDIIALLIVALVASPLGLAVFLRYGVWKGGARLIRRLRSKPPNSN